MSAVGDGPAPAGKAELRVVGTSVSRETDAVLDRLAQEVVRRRLTTPALLLLEVGRPLNFVSALAWAVVLLVLVGWAGPTVLAQYGLSGWKGAVVTGVLVLGLFKMLGMYERRTMEEGT